MKVQLETKERPWGGVVQECAPPARFLKFGPLKMHFCIQIVDVDLDAAVLPDTATATSGMSDVDASSNHMNELSPIKKISFYSQPTHCNCF